MIGTSSGCRMNTSCSSISGASSSCVIRSSSCRMNTSSSSMSGASSCYMIGASSRCMLCTSSIFVFAVSVSNAFPIRISPNMLWYAVATGVTFFFTLLLGCLQKFEAQPAGMRISGKVNGI